MSTIEYISISDEPDELINTSLNSSTNDENNFIGVSSKTSSKLTKLSKDYVNKSSDNDDKSHHKSKSHHRSSSKSSSSHKKTKSSADDYKETKSKHRSDKSDNVDDETSSNKKHKSKRHRSFETTHSGKKIMLIDPIEIPSKKRRESSNDKSSSTSKNASLSKTIVEMTKQLIDNNNNGQSTQIGISKKPRISRFLSDKSLSSSVTTQDKNDEQNQTKDNSSISTVTSTSSSTDIASLNNAVFTSEISKKIDDKNKKKKEPSTGDYLQKKKLRYQRELEEIERKRAENAYVIPKPKQPVKKQKIVKKIDPKTLKELTLMYESVSVPDELNEELNRQINSSGILQKENDNQSSTVSNDIDEISRGLFIRDPRRKSINKPTNPSGYISQSIIVTQENTTESINPLELGEANVTVNGPPVESFRQQNYPRMSNNFASIPYENIQARHNQPLNQHQNISTYNNQPLQSRQYPSTMYNQTGDNYSQHHQQYVSPMSNQSMECYQARSNYHRPVQPHQQFPSSVYNQSMEHYHIGNNYHQPVQHQQHPSTRNNQSMENYQTSDNYHQPVQANQQLMNAIVNTIKVSETNPALSNIINQIEKIPETINTSTSNQALPSSMISEPTKIIRVRNFANLPDSNDTNIMNESNDFYNLNDLTDEMEKITISDVPILCDNLNTKIPDELNIHDDVMSYDDCISNFANTMQPLLFDAQYGEKSISEIIEKKQKLIAKYMKLALNKNYNNLDLLLKDIYLYFKKNKLIFQLNENEILEIAEHVLDVDAFF